MDAKNTNTKDPKDTKDSKETKEPKETKETKTGATLSVGDPQTPPDQLLRLRLISAKLDVKKEVDAYAVVSIGKQSARTKLVKDTREPVWEENFAIGYEKEDEQSEILVEIFDKGRLMDDKIGEFKLRLGELVAPKSKSDFATDKDKEKKVKKDKKDKKDDSWVNAKPTEGALLTKKGDRVGTLILLLRREIRLHGLLKIDLKEMVLILPETAAVENNNSSPSSSEHAARPSRVVVKFGQEKHETAYSEPKVSKKEAKYTFKHSVQLTVNDTNNGSDVFFELWQQGQGQTAVVTDAATQKPLGEARLTLYDTRKKFDGNITFIGPCDHDVATQGPRRHLGQLKIFAKMQHEHKK